jgi:hypothetical protein
MKPKIDRFCEGYMAENYKRSDNKKENDVKFEWFVNSINIDKIINDATN